MQEEKENDACQNETDEDGVADAGDRFADELRLIVEEFQTHARRKLALQRCHLRSDGIGYLNGIRGDLLGDVEQHRRLAVGGDAGIDRHG